MGDNSDFNVLIVDDTSSNILLLEVILDSYNFNHLYKANTALEAYDILENHNVDAILLEVMMPDIDGIQACATIRSNPEYDLIPIIMVTANDDPKTLKKSFDAGSNDFLGKPINKEALIIRLNAQLQKRSLLQGLIEQSRFTAMDEIISMLAH